MTSSPGQWSKLTGNKGGNVYNCIRPGKLRDANDLNRIFLDDFFVEISLDTVLLMVLPFGDAGIGASLKTIALRCF